MICQVQWIEENVCCGQRQPPKGRWYCKTHQRFLNPELGRCMDDGLGDTVERLLLNVGITPDSWMKFNSYKVIGGQCPILIKTPEDELTCGCVERKAFLNMILPYEPFRKIYNAVLKWGIIHKINTIMRRKT